ncbi:hypothetical protein SK128_013761, partial [Halocaridina rubra]
DCTKIETLVYELQPEGIPDNQTRLQVNMSDVADGGNRTTTNFTICIRFNLKFYNEGPSTLLSYAYGDHDSDVINFWVSSDGVFVRYNTQHAKMIFTVHPLWWYALCMVVHLKGLELHIDGDHIHYSSSGKPLLLNGSLVVGQDQDVYDGGYARLQAFMGKVTNLTIWKSALTTEQVLSWSKCRDIRSSPFLVWENTTFNVHGNVKTFRFDQNAKNCSLNDHQFFLFPIKTNWNMAHSILTSHGFEFFVPQNEDEVEVVDDIVQKYGEHCINAAYDEKTVMLGIKCNRQTLEFYNINNNLTLSYSKWDKKSQNKIRNGLASGDCHASQHANCIWSTETGKLDDCFIGVKKKMGKIYQLYGKIDSDIYQQIYFVLAGYYKKSLLFHSGTGLGIWKNDTDWILWNSISKVKIAILKGISPIGQQDWNFYTDSSPHTLLFSHCDQITCSDGVCIPQSSRCNGVNDCNYATDESECHTAEGLQNQRVNSPPTDLQLLVRIYLNHIAKVDHLLMKYDIDFALEISWKDLRYLYRNLAPVGKTNMILKDKNIQVSELISSVVSICIWALAASITKL